MKEKSKKREARAAKLREEINSEESSPQNQKLFANINEKLKDNTLLSTGMTTTQIGKTHTG